MAVQSQFDFEYSAPTRSPASEVSLQRLLSTEVPSRLMPTTQAAALTSSESVLKKLADVASFMLAKGADEEDEYAREGQGVLYLTSTSSPTAVPMPRITERYERHPAEITTTVVPTTTAVQLTSTHYANVRTNSFIHLFSFNLIQSLP